MTERTPIDKTNPLALDKKLFEGEWFFKQTVVDKPYRFDVTFTGESSEPRILRWEVTESWLIGYDIHDHFEAVGTDGIRDQGKPPVVAYPIMDHFDIKLAENSTTGEDLPMLVENRDNPWWQRRYFVIDPSSNAISVYPMKYMQLTVDWDSPFMVEAVAGYNNMEFYDTTGDVINPRDYEKRYLAGGQYLRRGIGIGKALGQIDGVVSIGDTGHFADDRFSKKSQAISGCWHGISHWI